MVSGELLNTQAFPQGSSEDNGQSAFSVSQVLPSTLDCVIVVTKRFRCLGYIDADGSWKDLFRREPLSDVVAWMPI